MENAGIELCKVVMTDDDKVPFLIQSSSKRTKKIAEELGAGFIFKYSKSTVARAKEFYIQNLAFGPLCIQESWNNGADSNCQPTVQSLQQKLLLIPD